MAKHPPDPAAILRGLAAGNVGWKTAIYEWIDNAFDKNARHVTITMEKGILTIKDDGEGTDRPEDIVILGRHTDSGGVGQYGMGGKEALLWAGGEEGHIDIHTTHKGVVRRLEMNWKEYAANDWDLDEPTQHRAVANEIGTSIEVSPINRRLPRDTDELTQDIGYRYSYALRVGKAIELRIHKHPYPVQPWKPPEFEPEPKPVKTTIEVNGKPVHIHAGVVKQGLNNEHPGLTYFYGYRVIDADSGVGCGSYPRGRLCGFVELADRRWKSQFNRNKNGWRMEDEVLANAVEDTIRPILEAAQRAGLTFTRQELATNLSFRANRWYGTATDRNRKAKRDPKTNPTGTVEPQGTDQKHTRAKREQQGQTFGRSTRGSGFHVTFDNLGGHRIADVNGGYDIIMNLSNPYIKLLHDDNDENALFGMLATVIALSPPPAKRGQEPLDFDGAKSTLERIGKILADETALLNGKPALRLVSTTPAS